MRSLILTLFIMTYSSCGKIENSSSQDRFLYSQHPQGTPQFNAASVVLATKCGECHGSWTGFSESDFVLSGLITPQKIDTSKIYYRNQNASSGPGKRNMPSSGRPALSATELQTIVDWINAATP